MLSKDVNKLERENHELKKALNELGAKMESNQMAKPKSCQYCQNYIQHYIKGGIGYTREYVPIHAGHCTCGVPISKGRKRNPAPDDTCPYFVLGTHDLKDFR